MMLEYFSYLGAAVAFTVLMALLLTSWRGRVQGIYLLLPVMATMLWAAVAAWQSTRGTTIFPVYILIAELIKSSLWVLLAMRLLPADNHRLSGTKTRKYLYLLVFIVVAELCALTAGQMFHDSLVASQFVLIGFVALPVLGLVLLEQLYRNTRPEKRWAIKYLCIGLGGIFAFDFYLFADSLLFYRIDEAIWHVRGIIYVILMPLIAIAVARNPQWSFEIFVSRRMVFHSATLIAAGAYMLAMAAGGYYLKYFGGDLGRALQALFLFAALLTFVMILFSGQFRSRLRVFVTKNFFNYKYDYRDEWLRFTQSLADAQVGGLVEETVLRALAEIVDSPAGVLWVVEDDKSYVPAMQVGLENLTPVIINGRDTMIEFIADTNWVVNIDEYRTSPDKYEGMNIPQWLLAIERAWLLVPLVEAGELIGIVLLAKPRAQRSFNWEDSDLLKTAGNQAAVYLAQYRASQALVDARQFEAFNQFSTFIIHDIKNMVAQLSLMVRNAEKHRQNPEFVDDMIETTKNSVNKMEKLITQLRTGRLSITSSINKQVDLVAISEKVIKEKAIYEPVPQWRNEAGKYCHVTADPERLASIIGHLLQNSIDATSRLGLIKVVLSTDDELAMLSVSDSGCGMDEQFIRERLFKPFDTTKGSAGMGIGAYESREYIRKIGGSLSVASEVGSGTTFTISLPLASSVHG